MPLGEGRLGAVVLEGHWKPGIKNLPEHALHPGVRFPKAHALPSRDHFQYVGVCSSGHVYTHTFFPSKMK